MIGRVHHLLPVRPIPRTSTSARGRADQQHPAGPGETFSLNGIVGERTAANGFVEGFIIQGRQVQGGAGGGVSQSATTTFNAMFFAGLKDIQHQPHTLYIDRYPAGREATVAWPTLDLKFQNDTSTACWCRRPERRQSGRGSITVKMWSTRTYDRDDSDHAEESRASPAPGPHRRRLVGVRATVTGAGIRCELPAPFLSRRPGRQAENFSWRYAPTDRVRCV